MTEDPTIYAKHIEQSINVNIRTHSLQQLKRNYATKHTHTHTNATASRCTFAYHYVSA